MEEIRILREVNDKALYENDCLKKEAQQLTKKLKTR